MYNEQQKQTFLKYLKEGKITTESIIKRAASYFKQFATAEVAHSKDLSLFTEEEYSNAVSDTAGGGGLRTITAKHMFFKTYFTWLKENNLPYNPQLLNLSAKQIDASSTIKTYYIKNPQHLVEITDKMFPILSENKMGNMYRLTLYLLYMGIDKENIVKLKKRDISFEQMQITVGDNKFSIFPEFLLPLMYVWHQTHVVIDSVSSWQRDFDPTNDFYIRGQSDVIKWESIRKGIKRANEVCIEKDSSFPMIMERSIYLSGIMYKMHQEEINIGKIDIDKYAKQAFTTTKSDSNKAIREMRFHLNTAYKRWKSANNL